MADVTISYKGSEIASLSASGTKTLLTEATYCEDDITIAYTAPTPNLQAKTGVTPTTSSQTITPDSGYDGLSSVQINAMASGSAATPATTITANPSISVNMVGLITASVSKSQSITPSVTAGYVARGRAGTVTVSGSNTSQLPTKGAQTFTPTTTNQTIAASQYLTGVQTIRGDQNLLAENIKDGVTIFNTLGTYKGGGGGGGGGAVTISFYYPYDANSFQYADVYEGTYDNGMTEGDYVGSLDDAYDSKTFNISTNALVLKLGGSIVYPPFGFQNGLNVDGAVAVNYMRGYGEAEAELWFFVEGDGSIDLLGVSWDD